MLVRRMGFGMLMLFGHHVAAVLLQPQPTDMADIADMNSIAIQGTAAARFFQERPNEEALLEKRQATTSTTTSTSTSTATTATTTTIVATPRPQVTNGGVWQYEGCWYDNPKGSTFPVGPFGSATDGNRTVENCIQICVNVSCSSPVLDSKLSIVMANMQQGGYNSAAVENTFECWCGTSTSNTLPAQQLADTLCAAVCPGNAGENCGGNPDRLMWYLLGGYQTTRGPLSSSIASASRKSVSSASRVSASSAASVSRASRSSVMYVQVFGVVFLESFR